MQDNGAGVKIDRSRITHGESKRVAVMSMRLQQAQREMDADGVEANLNAIDGILAKMVIAVPADWLPQGVTMESADWLDHLTQAQYETIMKAAQPGE